MNRIALAAMLLPALLLRAADDEPMLGDKPVSVILRQLSDANRGIQLRASRALAEALDIARATAPVSVLDLGSGAGVWGRSLSPPHSESK